MKSLQNIVEEYLSGSGDDILITDSNKSFSRAEFKKMVYSYRKILEDLWSKLPDCSRGIAIILDRNADYLAVIFASWLAHGFYLPLNTISPKGLIKIQIEESGVSLIVSTTELSGELNFEYVLDPHSLNSASFNNLAYVIFTSGSTGGKKGVAISKTSLLSYMRDVKEVFVEKFIAKSLIINGELTFDISLADIVFALLFHTEICITSQASNLLSLCSIIKDRKVESVYAVPSTWELILDLESKIPDFSIGNIKNVFSGGESFTIKLLHQIRERCSSAIIFNMYGPTEFTINASYFEILDNEFLAAETVIIPIGSAFPGVEVFIKKGLPSMTEGELCLGGNQIMDGYVNAENPFITETGQIFYPTGDLVRQNEHGTIYYIGRIRDYEKVSGYRINLIDIEHKLDSLTSEKSKLMIVDGKIFCIVKTSSSSDEKSLRSRISAYANENLEQYERPTKIIFVDKFPLNSSGKLDRQIITALA